MHQDIVTALVGKIKSPSYLEIGCYDNVTFNHVQSPIKVGVDPARGGGIRMTSDQFFQLRRMPFDLIFIDGDHTLDQVTRDLYNAWDNVRPGGIVCLHDTYPTNDDCTWYWPQVHCEPWMLALALVDCLVPLYTVLDDCGVTVIQRQSDPLPSYDHVLEVARRKKWDDISPDAVRGINLQDFCLESIGWFGLS